MTIHLGPCRLYVAPAGTACPSSLFIAPLPPRRWSLAWLRSKLRRRKLSRRWVDVGYTNGGTWSL